MLQNGGGVVGVFFLSEKNESLGNTNSVVRIKQERNEIFFSFVNGSKKQDIYIYIHTHTHDCTLST